MELVITEPAEAELEEIGDYISEDNPARADSFTLELLERCSGLAENPTRYAVFTRWRGRELRKCPHGRYLIFYSIVGDAVEINHIVHSARDYARTLFPDA
jgi:plasmid stabilization system protein ParE